jgi:hypothetical protein
MRRRRRLKNRPLPSIATMPISPLVRERDRERKKERHTIDVL